MDIIGKVIQILPLQGGTSAASGKPWQLKTFILETQENYPRKVAIEVFGEQRIQDNPVEVDQIVTVSYDLESREFNGRWYTSVRAWKIQQGAIAPAVAPVQQPMAQPQVPGAVAAAPVAAPAAPAAPVTQTFDQAASASLDDNSGLPF